MPQQMRINIDLRPGARGDFFHYLPYPLRCQSVAVTREKDFAPGLLTHHSHALSREVLVDRIACCSSDWHNSGFRTFSYDPEDPFFQIEILKPGPRKFADPKSARVEQLDHRLITQWEWTTRQVSLQQTLYFRLVQCLRQIANQSRQREQLSRILFRQQTNPRES